MGSPEYLLGCVQTAFVFISSVIAWKMYVRLRDLKMTREELREAEKAMSDRV